MKYSSILNTVVKTLSSLAKGSVRVFPLKNKGIKYCLDLPGFTKEQVKVTVAGSVATVEAVKKSKKENIKLLLPRAVNETPSTAKLENGVLTLVFDPKAPEATQAKDVPVS